MSKKNKNKKPKKNDGQTSEKKSAPQIDAILHGLIHNDTLRCAIAITTDTTRAAKKKHGLDPMATIALGRTLACTALMGSALKEDQQFVHCQIAGNGPLGSVTAEYIAPASLRGFVQVPNLAEVLTPENPVPDSVGSAIGSEGTVTIKRGALGGNEPYTGISNLVSGEIAQDIAVYFADSEQIPSIVAAGVKLDSEGEVTGAGGILIQKIGGHEIDDDIIKQFEEKAANLNLSEKISNGATVQDLFDEITGMDSNELSLSAKPIGFRCFCSRDRMAMTLIGLGEKELKSILEDVGKIEIKCHYCSTLNQFDLEELLKNS